MSFEQLFTNDFPPRIEEVKIYFAQKGISEQEAEDFFLFYEKKHWTSKNGNFFKSWKNIAYKWIATVLQKEPFLFDRLVH